MPLYRCRGGHADAIIAQLRDIISQRAMTLYSLPTTHLRNLKDAQTKIDYLENLKSIAANCTSAESFKAEVEKQYPNYSGGNYLDMTAGFFFK